MAENAVLAVNALSKKKSNREAAKRARRGTLDLSGSSAS
jgi:hypothetical protein